MRSIYVHSCIDDKGWFHIMLVRLNPIQPVSVIPGNDFVTSEVWCQLDLPGIFGCYSFHGTGWKLKSLWESCSFGEKKCELVAANGCKIKKNFNCKCEAVGWRSWKWKLKSLSEFLSVSWSLLGKLHFSETSASWSPLMEVKSNQCCGKYCTAAHRNIVKTIGKTIEQKTTKNLLTKLLKNSQKQTDLNLEIINCTNQCLKALTWIHWTLSFSGCIQGPRIWGKDHLLSNCNTR